MDPSLVVQTAAFLQIPFAVKQVLALYRVELYMYIQTTNSISFCDISTAYLQTCLLYSHLLFQLLRIIVTLKAQHQPLTARRNIPSPGHVLASDLRGRLVGLAPSILDSWLRYRYAVHTLQTTSLEILENSPCRGRSKKA